MLHTDKTWICVHLDPFCYQNIQLNLFFLMCFYQTREWLGSDTSMA